MRPNNLILLNAVNNATTQSVAFDCSFMVTGSFQASFSDNTTTGTIVMQASDDPIELLPAGAAPTNWSPIPNTSTVIAAGALTLMPVQTINFRWIRVSWTRTAGAGTLTVTGFMQGFN
jgi:hypothetical protein